MVFIRLDTSLSKQTYSFLAAKNSNYICRFSSYSSLFLFFPFTNGRSKTLGCLYYFPWSHSLLYAQLWFSSLLEFSPSPNVKVQKLFTITLNILYPLEYYMIPSESRVTITSSFLCFYCLQNPSSLPLGVRMGLPSLLSSSSWKLVFWLQRSSSVRIRHEAAMSFPTH